MTLRSTTLIATFGLLVISAAARAQSTESGAAQAQSHEVIAPLTPTAPGMPVRDGTSAAAPVRLSSLSASATVADSPTRPAADKAVPKPARVPLAKRWWFWAGLGGAAVGVVLAAIFLGPRSPYNGNATPGTVGVF